MSASVSGRLKARLTSGSGVGQVVHSTQVVLELNGLTGGNDRDHVVCSCQLRTPFNLEVTR